MYGFFVRFSVFPLIYSCAGSTCGKLVKGCDKLVKGHGKLFKGHGRVVKGHADRSLHLGKTFRITERLFNPWPSNFVTITCNLQSCGCRFLIACFVW